MAFLDKILNYSNKKSTFVLVSGFFGCCIFTYLHKYCSKGHFFTKKAARTTIISIFDAELHYFIEKIGFLLNLRGQKWQQFTIFA